MERKRHLLFVVGTIVVVTAAVAIVRSAQWAHPEVEFVAADGPAPGSWKGLAGMAEGVRVLSAWEDARVEAER